MKILAISTSSKVCSICFSEDEEIIGEYSINNDKTHSVKLMPMLKELSSNLDINMNDVDYLSCDIGPGSFTGLRIGIASIKAFATALNKPTVGISSLTSLAYNINGYNGLICPMIDARNNSSYFSLFKTENGKYNLEYEYSAESVDTICEILNKYNSEILFVGDGAIIYKDILKENIKSNCIFANNSLNCQKASSLAKAAYDKILDNPNINEAISPMYLRKSQAERMIELNESNSNSKND